MYFIGSNDALLNVDGLEKLVAITEDLVVRNNIALADIDGLGSLFSVGKSITVTGNTSLPTGAAQALADRLVANGYEGEITIENNGSE